MNGTSTSTLCVVYRTTDTLRPYANNARTHSKRQIRQIADSIKAFGFTNPVLVDGKMMIIAGHGRVEAAKLLRMSEIPTIELSELSENEIRAYILADNKLAEKAGWDESILKIELQHLLTLDTGLDVTITGFEIGEIDLILRYSDSPEPEDKAPEMPGPAVTQIGDLWLLGEHRLLCASALEESSYTTLLDGASAQVAFTDPPYNVAIDGHVCGNGAIKHEEFAMAAGEMDEAQFTTFLNRCMSQLIRHTEKGSVHFLCMDWRHMREMLAAGSKNYDDLLNLCVWVKDNGGMGSLYRSQHELVFVYRNGSAPHRNNVQLGKYGRNRTNVWEYPGVNTMSKQSEEGNLLALHPTVKPIAMVSDALLDCSAPRDIALDPFLGSGTTLIAAEKTRRICYGLELSPKYVDVAIRRWEALTGRQAVHAVSGRVFADCVLHEESLHA
jgi:DNA modification methylase